MTDYTLPIDAEGPWEGRPVPPIKTCSIVKGLPYRMPHSHSTELTNNVKAMNAKSSENKSNNITAARAPKEKHPSQDSDKAEIVVVLGDIFRHIIVKPNPNKDEDDRQDKTSEPFKAYMAYAGAPILRQMIVEAITDKGQKAFTSEELQRVKDAEQKINLSGVTEERTKKQILKTITEAGNLPCRIIIDKEKVTNFLEICESVDNKNSKKDDQLEEKLEKSLEQLLETLELHKVNQDSVRNNELTQPELDGIYSAMQKLPMHIQKELIDKLRDKMPTKTPWDSYIRIIGIVGRKLARQIMAALFSYDSKLAPAYDESKVKRPAKRLVNVLDYFRRSSDSKPGEVVLRAKESEKYQYAAQAWPNDLSDDKGDQLNLNNQFVEMSNEKPKLLVVYDRDLNFRDYFWDDGKNSEPMLGKLISLMLKEGSGHGIVIAIEENLGQWEENKPADMGAKWLIELGRVVSSTPTVTSKCVVIITADALRKSGLNITVTGSLEQAVHDVVDNLHKPPLATIIGNDQTSFCDHLVVLFRENLAVYINLNNVDHYRNQEGWVHICPEFKRTAQAEPSTYGTTMPIRFPVMATAIIKSLYHESAAEQHNFMEAIQKGIRLGIASCNYLFDHGFCNPEAIPKRTDLSPFDAFEDSLCYERRKKLWELRSCQEISDTSFICSVGSCNSIHRENPPSGF